LPRRFAHTADRKTEVRPPLPDTNDLAGAALFNANVTSVSREDSSDDDVPILNVTDEDSPYALIDKFFPDRVGFLKSLIRASYLFNK